MKRANEATQQPGAQQNNDSNKRPRYTQANYGDVYAQYGMMSQYGQANPFTQPGANGGYGGYNQPMYNMGYGQSMMANQYGTAYPQAFPNAAPGYGSPAGMLSAEVSRTIYLGNVNKDMQPHDILKHVRTGLVESFRTCVEKSCAFLSFVDPTSAQAFYNEHLAKKLTVNDVDLKVGWGKSSSLSGSLKLQISSGATRTVYIGRLTESDTEESIRNSLNKFGPIENVKLIRDKNIAFVYFLSIGAASSCVVALSKDPEWMTKKINYGKDHCAAQADYSAFGFQQNPYGQQAVGFGAYGYADMQTTPIAPVGSVLRTLYLGNVHPEAKVEDLCNIIRGGNLLQVRYMAEKNIAFVTFMDAATALNVYNHAQSAGLVLRGRRLRVGWGKPSSISNPISQAIQQGATRNIYIGGIPETLTEEKLRSDFAEFGEIELVNTFREKKCAFVNFTSINNAITAIAAMKLRPEYADYKLNYGKDRCGNPFKTNTSKKYVKEEPNKQQDDKKENIHNTPLSPDAQQDGPTKVEPATN